jgi:hypothetical protein
MIYIIIIASTPVMCVSFACRVSWLSRVAITRAKLACLGSVTIFRVSPDAGSVAWPEYWAGLTHQPRDVIVIRNKSAILSLPAKIKSTVTSGMV